MAGLYFTSIVPLAENLGGLRTYVLQFEVRNTASGMDCLRDKPCSCGADAGQRKFYYLDSYILLMIMSCGISVCV